MSKRNTGAAHAANKRLWPKVLLVLLLVIILAAAEAALTVKGEIEGREDGADVTVTIQKGSSVSAIADALGQAGVIRFPLVFRWYVKEQGAAAQLPVVLCPNLPDALAQLRAWGCTCLAAALYNSQPLHQVDPNPAGGVCVVIGSEGQGLSQQVIDACDAAVRIPITSRVESLNASVAGSVLLWHFRGDLV